jgi:hypothetical protein
MLLFCGIAFFSEGLAFVLAISVEKQWEKDRKKAIACIYSLLVCAAVNLVSGHNAWVEFEGRMLAEQTRAQQVQIDAERGQLLDMLAQIDAELAVARPPVDSALGPAARAEARELYQIEVNRLQPRRDDAQRRLDALPLVAEQSHIIDPTMVWIAFALLELMKAVVLWGVGVGGGLAQVGAIVQNAAAAGALAAQTPKPAPAPIEPPALRDEPPITPPAPVLAQRALEAEYGPPQPAQRPTLPSNLEGRALLDVLVQSNVIDMRDISSKHASRPRPGRRKAVDGGPPAAANA